MGKYTVGDEPSCYMNNQRGSRQVNHSEAGGRLVKDEEQMHSTRLHCEILVVEDDAAICKNLCDLLANEGYTITAVPDGQVASDLSSAWTTMPVCNSPRSAHAYDEWI